MCVRQLAGNLMDIHDDAQGGGPDLIHIIVFLCLPSNLVERRSYQQFNPSSELEAFT